MEEFFPQNENLKTVLCRPSVEKSQNCEIFFWGYDGHTITRAEFTGMMIPGKKKKKLKHTEILVMCTLKHRIHLL